MYHEGIPSINVMTEGDELEVRTEHALWHPDIETKDLLSELYRRASGKRWIDCPGQERQCVRWARSNESKNRVLHAVIKAYLVALLAEYDLEDSVHRQ